MSMQCKWTVGCPKRNSCLDYCFVICFVHGIWSLKHRRTRIWHFRKWKTGDLNLCERGFAVTQCIFSWESDGGPEKGPLMLDVSISLYLSYSGLLSNFCIWHVCALHSRCLKGIAPPTQSCSRSWRHSYLAPSSRPTNTRSSLRESSGISTPMTSGGEFSWWKSHLVHFLWLEWEEF